MQSSLSLSSTPPQSSNKRQRSRDSRKNASQHTSAGQNGSEPDVQDRLARNGVRMPAYLSKSKTEIQAAFQDLEWKQRYRLSSGLNNPNSPFRLDKSSQTVLLRNRYGNIQPWDTSRVKLQTPIAGSDYINASPINLKSVPRRTLQRGRSDLSRRSLDSLQTPGSAETRYIATQGVKEGQFSHFWHMVMQETTGDVGVIIMLTTCYEGLKEKCGQYFPADTTDMIAISAEPKQEPTKPVDLNGDPFLDSEPISADADSDTGSDPTDNGSTESPFAQSEVVEYTESGSVEMILLKHDALTGSEVRELKLTIGHQTKTIYHYLYARWPDFGKPEADDRIALLELMRVSKGVAGYSPRIVHCSAGVGRTGTWIALDFLLRELQEDRLLEQGYFDSRPSNSQVQSPEQKETWGRSGPQKATTPPGNAPDFIHDTVDQLRTQRMMMVMNELQYAFIYEVLRDAFIEKYAEREVGAVVTQSGAEEPSPKVARMDSQVMSQDGAVSEAETEVAEGETESSIGRDEDPYAAVAPDQIMQGLQKDEQKRVEDHEVK